MPAQTTQDKINELSAKRQALLSDTESELATFHNPVRLAMLDEMKTELDKLFCIKNRERAAKRSEIPAHTHQRRR
jgi:hypothetical protein